MINTTPAVARMAASQVDKVGISMPNKTRNIETIITLLLAIGVATETSPRLTAAKIPH